MSDLMGQAENDGREGSIISSNQGGPPTVSSLRRRDKSRSSNASEEDNDGTQPNGHILTSEPSRSSGATKKGKVLLASADSKDKKSDGRLPSLEEILAQRQAYEETMRSILPDFPTIDATQVRDFQDLAVHVHEQTQFLQDSHSRGRLSLVQ